MGMLNKEDFDGDIKYTFEPPKWVMIVAVLLGLVAGWFFGVYILGWALIGLAYYITTAVLVAQATVTSLLLIIVGIVVLLILRSKFEMGFKVFLAFLIALLIGIAASRVAIMMGYSEATEAPFQIPTPDDKVLGSDDDEGNVTADGNETADDTRCLMNLNTPLEDRGSCRPNTIFKRSHEPLYMSAGY